MKAKILKMDSGEEFEVPDDREFQEQKRILHEMLAIIKGVDCSIKNITEIIDAAKGFPDPVVKIKHNRLRPKYYNRYGQYIKPVRERPTVDSIDWDDWEDYDYSIDEIFEQELLDYEELLKEDSKYDSNTGKCLKCGLKRRNYYEEKDCGRKRCVSCGAQEVKEPISEEEREKNKKEAFTKITDIVGRLLDVKKKISEIPNFGGSYANEELKTSFVKRINRLVNQLDAFKEDVEPVEDILSWDIKM